MRSLPIRRLIFGGLDIGTRYIAKMKSCSVYYWNQNKSKVESSLQWRYLFICLFIFDYRALFVCTKNRACLGIAIPAYFFNIFASIFGVFFCLLIKKLILRSKTIWQSMKEFPCAVWSVATFSHMNKEKIFFSWKPHIGVVWIFFR